MADIFDIGVSSLLSQQRAIATTGHNIANVNTDGYSRQRVEFDTRLPQAQNYGFVGSGVQLTTIERMYDQFAVKNLQIQTALSSELEVYHQFASQVDNLLANPEAGLSPTMLEFFNSVQGVADDPSSIPPRQVMLSQAQSLTDRFQYIYDRMNSLYDAANSQIRMTVDEVNSLASSIADLNLDINLQEGLAGGQPANDLRDQRDELIRQLSERVSTTVVEQDDGGLNVFIGSGQSLVIGSRALSLSVANNEFDPNQAEITLSTGSGTGVLITNTINGGSLGGLLDFDQQILQPAINQLGLIAVGLIETFNRQHNLGQDLNGQLGGDFFTPATVDVLPGNNTGGAVVTAAISDATSLTPSDYIIRADGADNYSLIRLSDQAIIRTDNITVGNTLTYTEDGVDFTIDASVVAAAGDEFKIRPTRYASRDISLAINDARQIAAASPLRTTGDINNLGTGEISGISVSNNAALTISGFANLAPGDTISVQINDITVTSAAHDGTADGSVGPNPGAAAALAAAIQAEITSNNRPWVVSETGGVITLSSTDGSTLSLDELVEGDASVDGTITVTPIGNSVNAGDGVLTAGQADGVDVQAVSSTGGLPLSANNGDITLTYDASVPGFIVSDAAFPLPAPTGYPGSPLAYNPVMDSVGVTFDLGGISFTMSGVPSDGDTFTITDNTAGVSDNRNALLLGQIQTSNFMLGGTADLQSSYGQLVAEVGTKTHQADINGKAQDVLLRQAVDARETVSGVNLDEEAANLMKYQQAYQAAAQVITTANGLFETLLNAVR